MDSDPTKSQNYISLMDLNRSLHVVININAEKFSLEKLHLKKSDEQVFHSDWPLLIFTEKRTRNVFKSLRLSIFFCCFCLSIGGQVAVKYERGRPAFGATIMMLCIIVLTPKTTTRLLLTHSLLLQGLIQILKGTWSLSHDTPMPSERMNLRFVVKWSIAGWAMTRMEMKNVTKLRESL